MHPNAAHRQRTSDYKSRHSKPFNWMADQHNKIRRKARPESNC